MTESTITTTHADGVTTLTLNRPGAMNSFTAAMHGELLAALEAAAADASVRCLILTGAGRGFCAGQDLGDPMAAPGQDLGRLITTHYVPLVERLRSMPMPVIAAVNGVAAGAGANLALCCDFVVAARSASFIQAFVKIGLVPDTGGTWLLPRLIGNARAMGLAMRGRCRTGRNSTGACRAARRNADAGPCGNAECNRSRANDDDERGTGKRGSDANPAWHRPRLPRRRGRVSQQAGGPFQ